jgi:molecular chaperone DnaK (HSP70)
MTRKSDNTLPVPVRGEEKPITKESSATKKKFALVPFGKKDYLPSVEVKRQHDGTLVTSESFGIEAVIEGRQGMMSVIIPQGKKVPVSNTRRYFPLEDYQPIVRVVAFKGEQPVAGSNTKLGEFVVSGLQRHPKDESQGIDICFTINKEGIILVDAVEVENPENHLKIKLEYHTEGLIKGVAKGLIREVVGIFLPSGKK